MPALSHIALFSLILAAPAVRAADTTAPQSDIRPLLQITWSRGADLPQGFQDSDGGILGRTLITACGFCSGGLDEDNRRKPGRYPRGFLRKAWAIEVDDPQAKWLALPDFPGVPRQGVFSAVVGEALYVWGGFNYDEPYTYGDGWRLQRNDGEWKWTPLPNLPRRVTSSGACVIGTTIYVCGGADYDATAFYTENDRSGTAPRLGARLISLDTANLDGGWRELPELPGTARFVLAVQAVNGNLYVIGGATGDRPGYGYCTVVDNWRFDPADNTWTRLRDLPVSSGNFPKSSNLVFENRYIILPGGHQYPHIANPDGTVRPAYGKASSARSDSGLHNDVFVYDTATNQFGAADKLPIDNNLPMAVVSGDEIFLLGGETGGGVVDGEYYGHHPDLFLRGRIRAITPE